MKLFISKLLNLFVFGFEKLLKTFEYESILEFGKSLMPTTRYQLTVPAMLLSLTFTGLEQTVEKLFGLDGFGFGALVSVFFLELFSGVAASLTRKEPISSIRLSRFTVKTVCYISLVGISNVLKNSFSLHDQSLSAWFAGWLYTFLVLHIVQENVVSILENLSVISGKDKTAWIAAIVNKLKSKI